MSPGPARHPGQAYLYVAELCWFGHVSLCMPWWTAAPLPGSRAPLPPAVWAARLSAGSRPGSENIWLRHAACGERVAAALIRIVGAVCLLRWEAGRNPTAARQAGRRRCWGPGWVIFSDRGGPAAFN